MQVHFEIMHDTHQHASNQSLTACERMALILSIPTPDLVSTWTAIYLLTEVDRAAGHDAKMFTSNQATFGLA